MTSVSIATIYFFIFLHCFTFKVHLSDNEESKQLRKDFAAFAMKDSKISSITASSSMVFIQPQSKHVVQVALQMIRIWLILAILIN